MNVRILPMKGYQQPYGQSVEVVENRFFMKVPSCAIEDTFTASRRRLHSPTKVSSFFLLAKADIHLLFMGY